MATTAAGLSDSIFVIWLLAAAIPTLAEQASVRQPGPEVLAPESTTWPARGSALRAGRLALGLLLVDGQGLSEDARSAAESEIERLFQSSGVDVRTVVSEHPLFVPPGFPVVRILLWPRDGTFLHASRSAMGTVRIDSGRQVESVHVFYPVIVSTLLDRDEAAEDLSARVIGRAVGRVCAHELIHALAPRVPHARFGLMRSAMDREFLGGLRLTPIDRRSAKAFLREVAARYQTAAWLDPAGAQR